MTPSFLTPILTPDEAKQQNQQQWESKAKYQKEQVTGELHYFLRDNPNGGRFLCPMCCSCGREVAESIATQLQESGWQVRYKIIYRYGAEHILFDISTKPFDGQSKWKQLTWWLGLE